MKGVIFTEFLGMVADRFSEDMVDDIIEASDLPSGGAYTAVGIYDHGEIVSLVGALSDRSGTPVADLVKAFGQHLFGRLSVLHPEFVVGIDDAMDFLERVDKVIHVEVLKLYPDAMLPRFDTRREGDRLQMIYRSPRGMEDLAEGLIHGCLGHFGQELRMERHKRPDGSTEFNLERLR